MSTSTLASRHRLAKAALVLSGLFGLSSAHAVSLCVNNAAMLQSMMQFGEFQDEPLKIMIVQGTYNMTNGVVVDLSVPTTIEGGYSPDCSSRTPNADNTVINVGQGHRWYVEQNESSPEALIAIDGLTFTNTNKGITFSAGFPNHIGWDDDGSLRITRTRFTQISSDSESYYPVLFLAQNNQILLENVQFDHVVGSAGGDACAVAVQGPSGGQVLLNHVSADLTGIGNLCLGKGYGDDPVEFNVYNSILRSYALGGGHVVGTPAEGSVLNLVNNIMFFSGVNATTHETNQLSQNPGWVDGANGNYHLAIAPLSAAINSGSYIPPGGEPPTDIEGKPRIQGSFPDRGARESNYNDQTVLTVTNTNDSGGGSLRQALLDANSSPLIAKQIKFDIRSPNLVPTCPAVIALNSMLPVIAAPISIDGYSQLLSIKNTDADAFNANLCVSIKAAAGSLPIGFKVPADAAAGVHFSLRGVGLGGFAQPVMILGGSNHVIAGNQFGGSSLGVNLPGAGLNAISIGVNASGSLIVGGNNVVDRNVIVDADFAGINIQSDVVSSIDKCQIVNNLIGLKPDGHSVLANFSGINAAGQGCGIVRNRIAGNTSVQVLIDGQKNVLHQNQIGITADGQGVANSATGVLIRGSGNIIGAGGNGGTLTANTIRFNQMGGVVIKGDSAASGNSVNANRIYDNGPASHGMDIDLQLTNGSADPTPNDAGDSDVGPNFLQNFPVAKRLVYTGDGNGIGGTDRPALLNGRLDALPGSYRIDAYFSSTINPIGKRGRAQKPIGNGSMVVSAGGVAMFALPVVVPSQIQGGVISFTATDSVGNTSEIGTALTTDTLFIDGVE